ncbi:MAG: aminomethyl-transferring glycine dehydrogenase subunit GcvPA [Candidatus Obscuribacterales bacterium]|nr:aminomethyl-transferring glycine dehydrogenase subunit GcvPA [Candidatus Obscuribacterales bacterium]
MTQKSPEKENFPYLPHTKDDREQMLRSIGARTFEELLSHIPQEIRVKELNIAPGLSELELSDYVRKLAEKNKSCSQVSSFLGGGVYRRYVPAAVPSMVSRSEFATAYTPYQPEVSQGTLQAIYEFQTAICLLTGMEVANASVYDGPNACAEAALMATRLNNRNKTLLAGSLNPEYAQVTKTYLETCGLETESLPVDAACLDASKINFENVSALVVQYPNYFGALEELDKLADAAHAGGALLVVVSDPINLGLLEAPGNFGADIVVGDAQQCGNGLSFGGPSAGFMATRNQYVRQLPGRLCGMTVDSRGQRAFTLTLQTREQHIRRAKATSNICTNQSLNALTMLVYLTMMGPRGLYELSEIGILRAHKLQESLCQIKGIKLKFAAPFMNEFLLELDKPVEAVLSAMKEKGILAGIHPAKDFPTLKNCLLVACTEMTSVAEIERYVETMNAIYTGIEAAPKKSAEVAGCC